MVVMTLVVMATMTTIEMVVGVKIIDIIMSLEAYVIRKSSVWTDLSVGEWTCRVRLLDSRRDRNLEALVSLEVSIKVIKGLIMVC